ncbi:MAG: 5-carboxymethyl-2-hydroxymuconate Delta-isomerase [Alphaproteobacteria bacterium]|nr:5-carboxymethyl-2-hydroxymuconate Delta-isomerase [Alphaproteobacteria bacterium]
MPHFVIEYSRDVAEKADMQEVMRAAFDAGVATGEMSAEALKVRARAYDEYVMHEEGKSFVHMTVFLLEGRDEAQKDKIGSMLLGALTGALTSVNSISIDIRDMDAKAYQKVVQ